VAGHARVTEVPESSRFVMVGDGMSLDLTGDIPDQVESGTFSMSPNDPTDASVAIRHMGGVNLCFVDGHVETVMLKTFMGKLANAPKSDVLRWESEYVNAAGTPTNPKTLWASDATKKAWSMEQLGLKRNPTNPLLWSVLGKHYAP
jgi:prepilin-type processing-associated H-X9-DG protein